ncbi:MAG TPA: hypothetical protein VH741_06985, partial [Candidatus Limnocylindrales bacterium]
NVRRPVQVAYGLGVPAVQATLDGCQLELSATSVPAAAGGAAFYGLAPSAASFTMLAGVVPQGGSANATIELTGGGAFLFSVSSFDQAVEALSPPIEVTAPDDCATGGWSGEVSLVGGVLHGGDPVDEGYIYLSQEDGAAVRVPAAQGEFVTADVDGVLDFGPVLPPLDGPFSLEAWGWRQGALVKIGSGSYTPPPAPPPGGAGDSAPISFGGGPPEFPVAALTSLKVLRGNWYAGNESPDPCGKEFCWYEEPLLATSLERPVSGSTTPINKKFRWSTLLNPSKLVWQVLPYPPAGTADLAPPFLIDTGVVFLDSGQTEGEFSIDFNKYFKATVPIVTQQDSAGGNVAIGPILFNPSATPAPTPTAGGGPGDPGAAIEAALQLAKFSDAFYVRLIPVYLNSALLPSNHVKLEIVEPTAQIPINDPHAGEGTNEKSYSLDWTYTPPEAANPKYARCALVKEVGPNVPFPWSETYKQAKAQGKPICYKPPSDDGWSPLDAFDAFVEFVADVWDFVADGYASIKKFVVQAVLTAVPCQQIASQAVCEQIATTALDAALASFGVPPSLPSFDAAIAAAKGDLAELIVEAAGSIPGVATACGLSEVGGQVSSKLKSCEDLAAIAIDKIVAQVKQARTTAAAKAAGIPNWPGLVLEPDPRGQYKPPSFTLTLTRTSEPGLPTNCHLSVHMKSSKKSWTFPELHQGVVKQTTADVAGAPFVPNGMVIKPLAAGESMTRTLWLTESYTWFESWRAELYWHYHEALPNANRAWALLTAGSELTFGVQGNCFKPSEKGPYVLPASAIDG